MNPEGYDKTTPNSGMFILFGWLQLVTEGLNDPRVIGQNIRDWLVKEGRKQTWLALKLKVNRVTVARWLTGQPPSIENLFQLADLMDVPVALLLIPGGVKMPKDALARILSEVPKSLLSN